MWSFRREMQFSVVPLHEELKKGTLKAILNQAGLSVEDLLK
jgi:predicted RNA binding protein YcfA (HicA-like mRNA interferase family)